MQKDSIPPFYYPTTIVFVDDSNDFLMNFSLQFDPGLAYKLFTSPYGAIEYLETKEHSKTAAALDGDVFSPNNDVIGCPTTMQTINLDLTNLYRKVYDQSRFDEVGIIVVDYSMPDINGLDVCQRLENQAMKKILLTGEADAQTAIDAFNDGIIDQFVLKSDPQVINKVAVIVRDMQHRYFREKLDLMAKLLTIDSPSYLEDSAFCELFYRLCKKHNIVEHYLTENTGTFLLLSAQGAANWLVVSTPEDIEMQIELANDNAAPAELVEKLTSGNYVLHFWEPARAYEVDPIEWDSYLYPAEKVVGRDTYHYAFVANPSISPLDTESIVSYDYYLEHVDRVAQGK